MVDDLQPGDIVICDWMRWVAGDWARDETESGREFTVTSVGRGSFRAKVPAGRALLFGSDGRQRHEGGTSTETSSHWMVAKRKGL